MKSKKKKIYLFDINNTPFDIINQITKNSSLTKDILNALELQSRRISSHVSQMNKLPSMGIIEFNQIYGNFDALIFKKEPSLIKKEPPLIKEEPLSFKEKNKFIAQEIFQTQYGISDKDISKYSSKEIELIESILNKYFN